MGLIRDNLADLGRIFLLHAERGIGLYRIDSRIIPYASHPGNRVAWWDDFAGVLDRLGSFVGLHGLRLEMHPGRHCLLNSPSPETVALSILELGWHVRFFDALRLDGSHKLLVRVGGTFGDKARAFDRFVSAINGMPESWRGRLAIETDARFGALDVLDASDRTGLPVVLAGPGGESEPGWRKPDARTVARCFATWGEADGPAIVHLGSPGGLEGLMTLVPGPASFDCLVDSAGGDQALWELRSRMGRRAGGVIP